ncbi:hypothetical protein [Wocania ichthyoenteri]|uniref:hypothetical protein n=1 Tax=Wocania ichthyoenteri TaxID=1230531 RepID=UPI00053F26D4|nr:hypothetical protein [Wocania ichthyoenteri]
MSNTLKSYTQQIEVSANSKETFYALNEGLEFWWSRTSNTKFCIGGQFTIHFENGYWWTFKIVEYVFNKELIWKCIDGEPEFNKEWIGHILHWIIDEKDSKTIINFHQMGLTPELHCYDVCSSTWDMFLTKKLKAYYKLNNILFQTRIY